MSKSSSTAAFLLSSIVAINIEFVLKVQTPPHSYEFYVLETLQERLQTLQCVTNMVYDKTCVVLLSKLPFNNVEMSRDKVSCLSNRLQF